MSLVTPQVRDGLFRDATSGDLYDFGEQVDSSQTTAGAATLTVKQFLAGILNRTGPGAAFNDTTPSASQIIAGLVGNAYQGSGNTTPAGIDAGATFRLKYINTVAFVATIVAGAGVTLAGITAVAASSVKDYLITVLNGTPQQVFAATTVNASAVITGLSNLQTQLLSPGMSVAGTGIAGGTTILSIQPGVGVTLSANATADGSLVALTFAPRIEMRSIGQMLL